MPTKKRSSRRRFGAARSGWSRCVQESPLPDGANFLLVVDQFEEIFRFRGKHESDEANLFVSILLAAASSPTANVYVILTMRSEFLGDCAVFLGLPEALNKGQFLTPRLSREERRRAIEGPMQIFEGRAEPGLVNR